MVQVISRNRLLRRNCHIGRSALLKGEHVDFFPYTMLHVIVHMWYDMWIDMNLMFIFDIVVRTM